MAKVAQLNTEQFFVGVVDDYGGSLPHGAIATFPPEMELEEYQRWRWNGSAYEIVYDYRKRTAYNESGEAYVVSSLGPLPKGHVFDENELPLTLEKINEYISAAILKRLDDFAKSLTYDKILSACSYATSKDPVFALEGQYCVDARDATWKKAYEVEQRMLAELQSGERKLPNIEEIKALWADFEAQLPPLAWPEGSRGYKGAGNG